MNAKDIFIEGGTVVTMDDDDRVFVGDVLVRDGRIVALGPTGTMTPMPGARTVDARGCYVIPGFVQTHVHLCQVLFRGLAEELPLLQWLSKYIWPLEAAHDAASLKASAKLGIAELLLSGTTSILDMGTVRHMDAVFEAAAETGYRLTSGKTLMDKGEGGLVEATAVGLSSSIDLAKRWHGAHGGRLRYAWSPRFILSCTDELMKQAAHDARAHGCLLHTHASENPAEVEAVRAATGKDNILALHALGYTGRDVVLAHCVHLSEEERDLLAQTGTKVAHCPSTNLKLASGIAPIPELLERGVTVGLGADGAPCNNRLSAFGEMRLAALLQKPRLGATAMPARDVLRMATRGGAQVLGLGEDVGTLAPGKKADVVVVEGNRPHLRPRVEPAAMLVFAAEGADVRHVFVDGEWLVRDAELVRMDLQTVLDDAERELDALLGRGGFGARQHPMRRPVSSR